MLLSQVIARNPLGQSEATCRVVLGDIPDSPDSPSVEAMTDTDILLSWKTPGRLNHSPIICYKVQMGYIGNVIHPSRSEVRCHILKLLSGIRSVMPSLIGISKQDRHFKSDVICSTILLIGNVSYMYTIASSVQFQTRRKGFPKHIRISGGENLIIL